MSTTPAAEPTDTDLVLAKLNGEAARIPWSELQRFFARGVNLRVSPRLDLIEVAAAFAQDRADLVRSWMAAGALAPVAADEARRWLATDAEPWAIVVKPWVLVQESFG
jgi:hypothetical protein